MTRVALIGRDRVGWSIDKDREHIERMVSAIPDMQLTRNLVRADIYLLVWHDQLRGIRTLPIRFLRTVSGLFGKKKKIVAWITNDVTQQASFLTRHWPVDVWIAPSVRVSTFLNAHHMPHALIPFYVSPAVFHQLPDAARDREALLQSLLSSVAHTHHSAAANIRGKFLIGSFQRDSLGGNLMQPKWQKNPDMLIEVCSMLPPASYCLVLAGPRRHYLIAQCEKKNIPYLFVGDEQPIERGVDDIHRNNLETDAMNKLYNLLDAYLVTSDSEGGPKAILEASLTKTLIYSTDVGFARDFLHPDLVVAVHDAKAMAGKLEHHIEQRMVKTIDAASVEQYRAYDYQAALSAMEPAQYRARLRDALQIAHGKVLTKQ